MTQIYYCKNFRGGGKIRVLLINKNFMEKISQNQIDVPMSGVENVEALKLEWGPELGKMNWNDAQVKIKELNSKLAEGEKPWRLPTRKELIAALEKIDSTSTGFTKGMFYWPSAEVDGDVAYFGYGSGGNVHYNDDYVINEHLVRCVR